MGMVWGLCWGGSSLWNQGPIGQGFCESGSPWGEGPRATGAGRGLCGVGVTTGHEARHEPRPRGVGVTMGVLVPVSTHEKGGVPLR